MIVLALWACQGESVERPEKQLALASLQVTFASVEKLGPHRYEATIERSEFQGDRLESKHTELLKIDWLNWDNFHVERRVDDKIVQDVCVVDHVAWKYSKT